MILIFCDRTNPHQNYQTKSPKSHSAATVIQSVIGSTSCDLEAGLPGATSTANNGYHSQRPAGGAQPISQVAHPLASPSQTVRPTKSKQVESQTAQPITQSQSLSASQTLHSASATQAPSQHHTYPPPAPIPQTNMVTQSCPIPALLPSVILAGDENLGEPIPGTGMMAPVPSTSIQPTPTFSFGRPLLLADSLSMQPAKSKRARNGDGNSTLPKVHVVEQDDLTTRVRITGLENKVGCIM